VLRQRRDRIRHRLESADPEKRPATGRPDGRCRSDRLRGVDLPERLQRRRFDGRTLGRRRSAGRLQQGQRYGLRADARSLLRPPDRRRATRQQRPHREDRHSDRRLGDHGGQSLRAARFGRQSRHGGERGGRHGADLPGPPRDGEA